MSPHWPWWRSLGDRAQPVDPMHRDIAREFRRSAWRRRQREEIELGYRDLGEAGA